VLDVCTLSTSRLRIEVVPELGAKMVSFCNPATGREWMWRPSPTAPLFRNEPTDAFDISPLIGADECLPTIAPCRWNGRELPDHGEVWARKWELDELTATRIRTSIRMQFLPLILERTISLAGNKALFEYVLTSISNQPERFLWAFHPLMPIEDIEEIELPAAIRSVQVASTKGFPSNASQWNWPEPMPGVRLDRIDFGSHIPGYAKLFLDFRQVPDGFAAVRRGRERLSFRFDPLKIPFLGLWITHGGWSGHTHLAIEPTNAPADSLCSAASRHTVIQPHQQLHWSFCMVLEWS